MNHNSTRTSQPKKKKVVRPSSFGTRGQWNAQRRTGQQRSGAPAAPSPHRQNQHRFHQFHGKKNYLTYLISLTTTTPYAVGGFEFDLTIQMLENTHGGLILFLFLSFFVFGAGTRLRHDENGHVVQGQFVEHRHNVIQFDQKPSDVLKKNLFLHFLQNFVTCFFFFIERKKSRILLF